SLSANTAGPRKHQLLATNSDHGLLVDEATSITRLLDSCLQLEHATGAGISCIRCPVIPRCAIRHDALAGRRDGARHVAEICGAVEVILPEVGAEADSELLFSASECARAVGRSR